MADGNNVLDYPQMTRQREENIQAKEIAYAEDVNAELDYIMDTFNQLVAMLTGEWGDGTGRIYDLVDDAVSLANQAITAAQNCVQKTGDTMTGHLNISLVPASDYNVVNKKYVDDTIDAELAEPINRITTLENWKTNLDATQIKLDNANFSSTNINDGMNELFISVSNGKAIVAAAITGKGIETASDASFKTMADNINAILTFTEGTAGGTATAADIAYGKTAYARGQLLVGTLVGFDTSDATATPYDILQGKTAYVNTGKIEGILTVNEDTGEPSYDIGAVEKVYSSNPDTLLLERLSPSFGSTRVAFTYYNDPAGKYYYWYKLSCSNTTLTVQNMDTKETKTFNIINDLKVKALTSNNDDVGTTENFKVFDINITKFGENAYLAIMVYLEGVAVTFPEYKAQYTLILLPFSSNANHIEQFTFNTDNNKYYYLNSLSSRNTNIITDRNGRLNKVISISEDKTKIAITMRYSTNEATVLFFDVNPEDLAIIKNTEISMDEAYDVQSMLIFSSVNKRLIIGENYLFIKKNNGSIAKCKLYSQESNTKMSNITTTEDGTYYVEICQIGNNTYLSYGTITIDYEAGTLQQTKINRMLMPTLTIPVGTITQVEHRLYFMGNSNILIAKYRKQSYGDVGIVYKVNFESSNVFEPILETEEEFYTNELVTYAGTNCIIIGRDARFIIDPDYTNVIGLKFNNEYYYKQEKGILSATPSDVTTGKTFIGYNGEIETGTMEV